MAKVKFGSGVHSPAMWAENLLGQLFLDGTIPEYEGAEWYSICYGDLCAYSAPDVLLATWSEEVPDTHHDVVVVGTAYRDGGGKWEKYSE